MALTETLLVVGTQCGQLRQYPCAGLLPEPERPVAGQQIHAGLT